MNWTSQYRAAPHAGLSYFDVEVNTGSRWVSLNDQLRYRVGSETLAQEAQARRNITAASPMYDGTWVVHSSEDNVTEIVEIQVTGPDFSAVEEAVADLIEWFKQPNYYLRLSLDNHVETWQCFPADWSRIRGHVHAHNRLQIVRLSVPRLPNVTREVRA